MKTRSSLLRLAAAATVLVSSGTAHAVLLDHGPQDPILVFPTWYRDLDGLALKQCLSTTPSSNPGAAAGPMCFPWATDPAGFPGNAGAEIFYSNLTALLKGPGFLGRYVAALEGTYLPLGVPAHGTETVFARIRVLMNTSVPGTYKVTHPYGVEIFPDVGVGRRALFFTADVPVGAPMDFDTALDGRVGPFPRWDFVEPGFTLDYTNPTTNVTESFVGDPNIDHSFTGSPFGTNYIRIDGPPGSNLDGAGHDFIQSPLAAVVGQKYTAPIPTRLTIKRATYTRDPVRNVISVDVYATSAPGNKMILTGVDLPTVQMKGDATGHYVAHVEMPGAAIPPASVSVTNMTSNPVNTATAGLSDLVQITSATYDTLTNAVSVAAVSSDKLVPGPALTVLGPLGGAMVTGAYSTTLAAGVLPPASITVQSGAGGIDTAEVAVLPGLPMNPLVRPVAVADALTPPPNGV